MDTFVKLENITKIYHMGEVEIRAVDGIDFSIQKGEFVVIVGPSGAGKTTVLNILGGMDTASGGRITVDGQDITKYSERQLTGYRRDDIGFVFQFYNLIPNLTALENVEMALQICRNPLDARAVLKEVGLEERMDNFPAQLSGGEQQRVSIARALAKNPKLLLCDEPTGSVQLVQHYPKTTPVIFWSLSILISLMTERQRVRFSSRVKVSYIFLKSFCNSFSTAAKSGGVSCVMSGIWFNAAVYIS